MGITMNKLKLIFSFLYLIPILAKAAAPLEAVQIYTQDELLTLIKTNSHLSRVKLDNCQLVQDIEARAMKMKIPAYQFLFGDMLAYAVCVDRDVEQGIYYMKLAAEQGLPEALEQMGRYYHLAKFVQKDLDKAIVYLRESASLGNLNAQMRLVSMFNQGIGSPRDYEDAYHWLFNSITADKKTHDKIDQLLNTLAKKMPASVIKRARKSL
ncbi:Sel1 repeat-containing protein [Pseudoalteromonas denitrificans DSM 6059]|uniref:Sel1 repeat-containing protein n=2 Tax=Pseudoalteromonas TaxID=53246 RepID=A0A1I1K7N1_9GAMM|nr:Sel1 repeat-containing protein [Pseudoalteromonas denitrificans DSM 6059]